MMFHFGFNRKKQNNEKSSLFGANGIPASLTLITTEDVFSSIPGDDAQTDKRPVLLVKAGTSVGIQDLPKLIRYGAKPDQFRLEDRQADGKKQTIDMDDRLLAVMTSPFKTQTDLANLVRQKDALVLETDERAINRMIDCLSASGLSLHRIHPVYLMNHLFWALEKYNAKIVCIGIQANVDYQKLYETLQRLKTYKQVETLILSVDDSFRSTNSMDWLNDLSQTYDAQIVFKPVSRFMLRPIVQGQQTTRSAV